MDNNETALAVTGTETSLESTITSDKRTYCSFKAETIEARTMLFNGMNKPDHRLADEINSVINVVDVFAQEITVVKPETGEISDATRVVLFDDKGESHTAVSIGIYNAVKGLVAVFGKPTWTPAIPLRVVQISTSKTNKMLTLEVVKAAPKK